MLVKEFRQPIAHSRQVWSSCLTSDEQGDGCESAVFRLETLQKRHKCKSIQCRVEEAGVYDRVSVQSVHYSHIRYLLLSVQRP